MGHACFVFTEGILGCLAVRDVCHNSSEPHKTAHSIPDLETSIMDPANRAVGPSNPILDADAGLASHQLREDTADVLAFLRHYGFNPLMRVPVESLGRATPDALI